MLNKQYLYGSHIITVLDYDINEERGRFYLWTDRKTEPYDRPLDAVQPFLSEFRPVSNVPAVVPNDQQQQSNLPAMLGSPELASQLKEILLENIEKIKSDKEYIPQAEAVMANVNGMIDLAKVEVGYIMALAKLNKTRDDHEF
jgi:hypothetical protein